MSNEKQNTELKQADIRQHMENTFETMLFEGLKCGGSHIVANKSHGKTFLLFSIAQALQKQENIRVLAFDSSETWIYKASRIPVYNVSERDILESERRNSQAFEKYTLRNANLLRMALDTEKDLLFRFKTRQPSKKAFFVRSVVNYLDQKQRVEKTTSESHEPKQAIAYILEEAQGIFTNRTTASKETETFLSVFNEARNQKESFFTASQRLNDFSKTIRSKQLSVIGKLSNEDITPFLRKIEKSQGLSFAEMKPQTWFYDGKTFLSPTFSQGNGKPFIINETLKQKWLSSLPKKKTLSEKINDWLNKQRTKAQTQRDERRISQGLDEMNNEDQKEERDLNDSDGLMSLDSEDILFPE